MATINEITVCDSKVYLYNAQTQIKERVNFSFTALHLACYPQKEVPKIENWIGNPLFYNICKCGYFNTPEANCRHVKEVDELGVFRVEQGVRIYNPCKPIKPLERVETVEKILDEVIEDYLVYDMKVARKERNKLEQIAERKKKNIENIIRIEGSARTNMKTKEWCIQMEKRKRARRHRKAMKRAETSGQLDEELRVLAQMGIGDAIGEARVAMKNFNSIVNEARDRLPEIDKIITNTRKATDEISSPKDFVTGLIKEQLDDSTSNFPQLSELYGKLDWRFIGNRMIDFIGMIREKASWSRIAETATRILVDLGCAGTIIKSILFRLKDIVVSVRQYWNGAGVVAQADCGTFGNIFQDLPYELMAKICALIIVGVGAIVFKVIPEANTAEEYMKSLGNKGFQIFQITKGASAVANIFTGLKNMVMDVFTWFLGKELVEQTHLSELKKVEGSLFAWATRVQELDNEFSKSDMLYDYQLQNEVLKMKSDAQKYEKLIFKQTQDRNIVECVRTIAKKCYEQAKLVETSRVTAPTRVDPYCFSACGEPRIGKSAIMNDFINAIAESQNVPMANRVYSRFSSSKHWDGYTRQFAVAMDDFAQAVESDEYNEFIRLKSNQAFLPPMADLSDKGRSFESMVIAQTTNVPYVQPTCLRVYEALWGRRNDLLYFRVKPGFRDPEGYVYYQQDMSHLEIILLHPMKANSLQILDSLPALSVEECKHYLIDRYYTHMSAQNRLMESKY